MSNTTFSSIKIGLASPEMIRSWSHGEVKKPETINYRTTKPEREGLFCEKIFGPTRDWECSCGKYKRVRYKGKVCEKCGVEVTTKKVRRERMGHIELAAPVSHIWYFKAVPSRMGLLLDIAPHALERVLYFVDYIVLDPGKTPLVKMQNLSDSEYKRYHTLYENDFKVGMGAEAIKQLLAEVDVEMLSEQLKNELSEASGQRKAKAIKRLEVVEALRKSGNKPEWMILEAIPVLPPEIRPMVQLDGGRYASSDLNDLYRRVINRNNRLKKLLDLHAPQIIIRNEKRMLQEAVDALIDNGRRGKPVTGGSSNRPLKSLSEILRGKQGRFRQNLLGKRVDYSGRSVIVVGPELKIFQCGLPKEMALELFKPFVMKRLVETGKAGNIKDAKKRVDRVETAVWDALEMVIKEHPVLLNRAPTLHRLSIQAFEPVLVEGRAIKLHPLVCTAFNADFDGDQMPVHVPLSAEAQAEARFLMLSANNLLKPADGRAVAVPSQDMVLGSYYLTIDKAGEIGEGKCFRDFDEAMLAYSTGNLGIHAPIKVKISKETDGKTVTGVIKTTLGRLIFNQSIPQDLGFIDRSKPENTLILETDGFVKGGVIQPVGKKELGKIVDATIKFHGSAGAAELLDYIKNMGYKYSTKAAISIAVSDVVVPTEKAAILAEADKKVEALWAQYEAGEMTDEERYREVIKVWDVATEDVTKKLDTSFDRYNSIKMMADSGARGSSLQMRQLAGLRGLMYTAAGKTIEIPIKSNFREGLNILEYFTAARGARKSLSDTALRTADSGYLTRRLVDVSQDVIIREIDCGATEGIEVEDIMDFAGTNVIEPLQERLVGRYTLGAIVNPATGAVIVPANTLITEPLAKAAVDAGVKKATLRTILECRAAHGVCAHCYGSDLSSGKTVSVGESVGIIAAQSIGEPGTQLTMRTFHTGGVAGSNITMGLPRVEEVFEARRPKKAGVISEVDGSFTYEADKNNNKTVTVKTPDGQEIQYKIPYNLDINKTLFDSGYVMKGQSFTEGDKAPQDILRISGVEAVYDYIIKEVQKVYRMQAVNINDRHIEVIARQMTRKMRVEDEGDTDLLPGAMIEKTDLESENARIAAENEYIEAARAAGDETLVPKRPAKAIPLLLGITKASLGTESFLSAASFQETTKVLTEAAMKGKVDNLVGLKENVIIGKLIPAGTGLERYRDIEIGQYRTQEELAEIERAEQEREAYQEQLRARETVTFDDDDEDDGFVAKIKRAAERSKLGRLQ